MIERISQKILDILQADARLIAGGSAYAAGWPSVTREENGDTPTQGSLNLFDKPHDPDGAGHRPAIYVGTRNLEGTDTEDFPVCSSGARIEYRRLLLPLIVCVMADTKRQARQQRNQLRYNIKIILLEHIRADGYWYELTFPGGTGGATSERVLTTASGSGGQQVAEAMGIVPVQVRYSWSAASLA